MKISELELKLRAIRKTEGDLTVYYEDTAPGMAQHCSQVEDITVNPGYIHAPFVVLHRKELKAQGVTK